MASPAFPGLAFPGDSWPGVSDGTVGITFEPPTERLRFQSDDPLFKRMSLEVGLTVLKSPLGSYTTVRNPSDEQIDAAEICYLGGYVYEVTDSEAADLTAAGYTVTYPS